MRTRRQADWLAGLVLGVLAGILLFTFPIVGLTFGAVSGLLVVLRGRPRPTGAGGLLVGIGGTWLMVLVQALLRCISFDAQPGQECVAPTIEGYVVVSAVVLLAGVGLTILGARGRTTE